MSNSNLTKAQKTERSESLERLRGSLSPGDTVYCILRHRSRSNMSRVLQLVKMTPDGPYYLGWNVSTALGIPYDKKHEGLRIGGCGFDAGHEAVYSLARALWPEGFGCIGEKCRSNDHSNGDRDRTPHGAKNGKPVSLGGTCEDVFSHWHRAGGYALRQEWL
jgi:hypothetical protein